MEDKLVSWMLRGQYHYRDISFKQVDLAYDSIFSLELNFQSFIEFIQRTYDGA